MSLPSRDDKVGIAKVATMYFGEGKPLREIGDRFGVSGEAVRQFLNRHYPDRVGGKTFRQELVAAEKKQAEEAEYEALLANAPPCVVCYEPVLRKTGGRGSNRTHSAACSELWAKARFLLDPVLKERQRQSMVRSILRYPKTHKPSAVKWAKKVKKGEDIEHKTFIRPDSAARKAYEEVMAIRNAKCSVCGTLPEPKATKHHNDHMKGKVKVVHQQTR